MDYFRVGRIANAILGAWLVVSAFLLSSPSSGRGINALVVGAASIAFDIGALTRLPELRFATAAVSVWLFVSPWIVPGGSPLTVANDLVVATLMFGFAVMPPEPDVVPAHMGLRPPRPETWPPTSGQ